MEKYYRRVFSIGLVLVLAGLFIMRGLSSGATTFTDVNCVSVSIVQCQSNCFIVSGSCDTGCDPATARCKQGEIKNGYGDSVNICITPLEHVDCEGEWTVVSEIKTGDAVCVQTNWDCDGDGEDDGPWAYNVGYYGNGLNCNDDVEDDCAGYICS